MPMHDWTRVPAGIFHHFHHEWISAIALALNKGILPEGYYSLAEQHAAGFGPDVLALQARGKKGQGPANKGKRRGPTTTLVKPRVRLTAETEAIFYGRKQKFIAVRHVSDDEIVAMIEIVSPGNKGSRHAVQAFSEKAFQLLEQHIYLMIVDVFPPGPRDPQGMHGAIWENYAEEEYVLPRDKPLTLASYEADFTVRAYVETFAVGDALTDMPLFLEPGGCVEVPLEKTYQAAWEAVPQRWQEELISAKP
jgi:hypothetical protein